MAELSPRYRALGFRDAREALSAALKAQNKRVPEGLMEEAAGGAVGRAGSSNPFKKLRTGKGWNAGGGTEKEEREKREQEEGRGEEEGGVESDEELRERQAERRAWEQRQQRRGEVDDAREEVGERRGEEARVATSKMQMLKNRMRQSSRSNIMSSASDMAAAQSEEGEREGRQRSPRRTGGEWGRRGRVEEVGKEAAAPVRPTPRSPPHLGQHPSAFLSYQAAAAAEREGELFRAAPSSLVGVFEGEELVERHRPGAASHVAQVLKQRQVCWQGKVKHKLKGSLVELFHLAATIPADLAEQFPPSLYVSELRHRSEVTLSNFTWVQCSSRILTEKQTSKLQLLSDNKLVAIVRLQHCELILLPDFDPSSCAIRMTGFLLAERIYPR